MASYRCAGAIPAFRVHSSCRVHTRSGRPRPEPPTRVGLAATSLRSVVGHVVSRVGLGRANHDRMTMDTSDPPLTKLLKGLRSAWKQNSEAEDLRKKAQQRLETLQKQQAKIKYSTRAAYSMYSLLHSLLYVVSGIVDTAAIVQSLYLEMQNPTVGGRSKKLPPRTRISSSSGPLA